MSGQWKQGICGCCNDISSCCCAYCCPCVTMGTIAGKMGHSCCLYTIGYFIPVLDFICLCNLRAQIRHEHHIDGGCCSDTLAICCCHCCALAQMKNQVEEN